MVGPKGKYKSGLPKRVAVGTEACGASITAQSRACTATLSSCQSLWVNPRMFKLSRYELRSNEAVASIA
jgi:hypothetical protein